MSSDESYHSIRTLRDSTVGQRRKRPRLSTVGTTTNRRKTTKKSRSKVTQQAPTADSSASHRMAGQNQGFQVPPEVAAVLTPRKMAALQMAMLGGGQPQQQVQVNIPPIRIRHANPNLRIPEFDSKKTTASIYLNDVESYFRNQGIEDADRLSSVSTILSPECKLWFDHIKQTTNSWLDFRRVFESKYDSWQQRQERTAYLINRRQRDGEESETFIWEMLRLSKLVYPNEALEDSVRRARDALLPSIRCCLGELSNYQPDILIERARTVTKDIQARDRKQGFYSNQQSRYKSQNNPNSSQAQRPVNPTNSQSQPNVNPPGRQEYSNNLNINAKSFKSQQQVENNASSSQPKTQGQKREYNGGAYPNSKKTQGACYHCKEVGHFKRQCPRRQAFVAVDPERNSEVNLNEEGSQ